MPGNYPALFAWNKIQGCMRYTADMNGPILLGISWQDADYVLSKFRVKVNSLLMEKLQTLERLSVKECMERRNKDE